MDYEDQTKGQLINELKELRERLSGLDKTSDELTGLHNREYFLDLAECEFIRSQRFQRPLSVILIAVKDFDVIKSDFNKEVSNQVLLEVVNRCKSRVRDLDYFGRYDEGELILLLPEADKSAIQKIAERLQETVAKSKISTDAGDMEVNLCQGGVEISEGFSNLEEFLAKAEEFLLSAKKGDNGNIVVR
ncbi:MAG: GGDEF domain-containing protein [candidate division WOR-3 bacterium]|jgi:diguanylate cyclase (GGDEF)-like protein